MRRTVEESLALREGGVACDEACVGKRGGEDVQQHQRTECEESEDDPQESGQYRNREFSGGQRLQVISNQELPSQLNRFW